MLYRSHSAKKRLFLDRDSVAFGRLAGCAARVVSFSSFTSSSLGYHAFLDLSSDLCLFNGGGLYGAFTVRVNARY